MRDGGRQTAVRTRSRVVRILQGLGPIRRPARGVVLEATPLLGVAVVMLEVYDLTGLVLPGRRSMELTGEGVACRLTA